MMKEKWVSTSRGKEVILKDSELHIWKVKVSEQLNNINSYWDILSNEEKARANSFNFIKDQSSYIITRAILRKILAKYLQNILPENILFYKNNCGKPFLSNYLNSSNIKFNLSHSNDCIIYAFSKNIDIGVDIEYVNSGLEITNAIEYCCCEQEKLKIQKLSNNYKRHFFYKLWVIKEALVKAMGLGVSFDLRKINILINHKLTNAVKAINNSFVIWSVNAFPAYKGYYSAFAAAKPIEEAKFFSY